MQNKSNSILIKTIGIASVILIVIICGIYFYRNYSARYKAYLRVGNHNISKCEYDYYYNSFYKYYMDNFSSLFDYMGVDSNQDILTQEYENGMTFKEMFEKGTLDQIKEIYCLYDEAQSKGFEFDPEEEYQGFYDTIVASLKNTDSSVDDYFKSYYGDYITQKLAKKYITMGYYSLEYYNKLIEDEGNDFAYSHKEELKKNMEVTFY